MPRRLAAACALGALLLPPALPAHAQTPTGASREAESPIDDQGSSYHYRTYITHIVPTVPGLSLHVLEFADRLLMVNHTGRTVTVYGYYNEPYARIRANGVVEVNLHSPAYYLNQNFYADVTVPAFATSGAAAAWTVIDRANQFEWHDHRIHWMSPTVPPIVTDQARRTKVFAWQVPLRVGAQPATIDGQLYWVPEEGTRTPISAIVALVVIVLLGAGVVVLVRRWRRSVTPSGEAW